MSLPGSKALTGVLSYKSRAVRRRPGEGSPLPGRKSGGPRRAGRDRRVGERDRGAEAQGERREGSPRRGARPRQTDECRIAGLGNRRKKHSGAGGPKRLPACVAAGGYSTGVGRWLREVPDEEDVFRPEQGILLV